MAKLTTPIPQDKIGESFVWRDWFQRLSDKVFGTMAQQDASSVAITGGSISNIDLNGNNISNAHITNSFIESTTIGLNNPAAGSFTSVVLGTPLAVSYGGTGVKTATANYVFAGPTSGSAAAPSFRALVTSDIPALTSGTSILYGNNSGGFSNVTIGSGITFASGTLSATGSGGTVTSVTGTAPIASSGGTTPAISITQASTSTNGYLSSTDWNTFNGKQPAGTYVTSVSGTTPVVSSGGTTPAISMAAASASANGYLTSTDWTTFNNKGLGTVTSVAALTLGTTGTDLSSTVVNGTTTPVITLNVPTASATNRGVLSSTDWTTFNNKGSGTVTSVTGTAPVVSSGGTTPAISMAAASASANGYLTSTDWTTFNGKQAAGTYVTSLTVTSANGFAGSFTSGATPALTISTSITGLLKGNGTAISAAVANTDYVPLSTVLTKTADYTITGTDTWIINNKTGSALTLTFPAASSWTGRYITVKNMQALAVNSATSNIVPIDSTSAGTAILLGVVGNWATLVSDGTNWVIMQAASNNNLLLE
jgi:hypothetical protein